MSSVVADPKLKDRLKQLDATINDLRDERAVAAREQKAVVEAYAKTDVKPGSKEFTAAKEATRAVGELDEKIAAYENERVEVLRMLSGQRTSSSADPGAAPPTAGGWSSGHLLENDSVRTELQEMASTTMRVGRVHLGQVMDRDALAASFAAAVTGTANMRRGDYIGVVPQLRRALRILDLIPTGTTDMNVVPYTQESGSFATAVETAEGGLKPEAAVDFLDAEAKAATIAHWTKTRKQLLADQPGLQTVLDGRLRYGVERRLQDQILAGNGVGENMRGILNTTGIGAIAYSAGELVSDQVLRGLTAVLLADGEANAIVMHPTDWQSALIAKAAGDGHYYSNGPFSITPQTMWGVPLIPSSAIPVGTVLVGDFTLGVQLFIREGVILLISDSDQDDFIRNQVTLLAEMRAALAVWRPAVFTTVDVAA